VPVGSPVVPEEFRHSFAAFDRLVDCDAEALDGRVMTQLKIGSAEKLLVTMRTAMGPDEIAAPAAARRVQVTAKRIDLDLETRFRLGWSNDSTLVVADLQGGRGTETDEDGRFEIVGLGDGPYVVAASFPSWILAGDPPSVPGGTSGLELVLAPGGEIRGTVYGPDGLPVAGARVNDAVTDAEGRYRITGLAPGEVDVFAGPGGPSRILFLRYAEAGRLDLPDLASVQLDGDTRHGITIRDDQITVTPDATPDASRPGIAVRRGLFVNEGQVLEGIDLHLPPARVVDGFVLDDVGAPVADASVEFRASEEVPYFPANRQATTGPDGFFSMQGVYDVAASVVASAGGHFESAPVDAGPESAVKGLRLQLTRAAAVRGEVAGEATLVFEPLDAPDSEVVSRPIAPASEESATFRVGELRPGRYLVRASAGAEDPVELGVVDLAPGETLDLGDISFSLGLR
jgi:hypothetical protein